MKIVPILVPLNSVLYTRRTAETISDKEIARLRRFFSRFDVDQPVNDISAYSKEDRAFHNYVTDLGSKEFLKSILQSYNIISFSYQFATSEGLVRAPAETLPVHLAIN